MVATADQSRSAMFSVFCNEEDSWDLVEAMPMSPPAVSKEPTCLQWERIDLADVDAAPDNTHVIDIALCDAGSSDDTSY